MHKDVSAAERFSKAKGDSRLADELIRDYLPFIRAEASKTVGRMVSERDDEMSIAMIAFHQAIESYSKLKGAFLSYTAVVIRRKLIDYYRREKRHRGAVSLDEQVRDDHSTLGETLPDKSDDYERSGSRDATRQEIAELSAQLNGFGVSLSDIADNCPKQDRTLGACHKALQYAKDNPELIAELKRTQKLPVARLSEGAGVERKTLERHRKYLVALLLIYSNGYEIIRGHLKQVLTPGKGGRTA